MMVMLNQIITARSLKKLGNLRGIHDLTNNDSCRMNVSTVQI